MKIYSVGGSVRDSLLGIESKDLDYVVVLGEESEKDILNKLPIEYGYNVMKNYMIDQGFDIFLENPEMVTIRARFPKGHKNEKQTADFVCARFETGYEEGTRRPILKVGTLMQDLERRDFTINAMAEDEEENLIDLFDGERDLKDRLLRTPVNAVFTFNDDALRLMRALRFSVTKGFRLSEDIQSAILNPHIREKLLKVVSQERIREELFKMFKHDTIASIQILTKYNLLDLCFGGNLWLKPTMEKNN